MVDIEVQVMQSLDHTSSALDDPANRDQAYSGSSGDLTLLDAIDRILDKGMVINGDISIEISGVELLSLKVNLVIASLETAKRYGIQLPWEKWGDNSGEKQLPEESDKFRIPDEIVQGSGSGLFLRPHADKLRPSKHNARSRHDSMDAKKSHKKTARIPAGLKTDR
jgi:Gas vesicle protein